MPRLSRLSASQRALNRRLRNRSNRENTTYSAIENENNASSQRERREDSEIRRVERIIDRTRRTARRRNPQTGHQEQDQDTLRRSIRRQDPNVRATEQQNDTESRRQRRTDAEIRETERVADRHRRSNRRRDTNVRILERERDRIARSQARDNPARRIVDQAVNSARRQSARLLQRQAITDAIRRISQRVSQNRSISQNREAENRRNADRMRENRANNSQVAVITQLEVKIREFNKHVKWGPNQVCLCCKGLWFPSQVTEISRAFVESKASLLNHSSDLLSDDNKLQLCSTCLRNIALGKKPKFAIINGLDFPDLPPCLKGLTPLEERLISPRLPFMVIKSLGVGRQSAIKGAVVNVPIPVSNIVTSLPRAFNEAEVIQLHLKRRMEFRHDYMTETIRPLKVTDAIRHLINTELYLKHNVVLNQQWISTYTSDTVPFVVSQADVELVDELNREFQQPFHPEEDVEMEELNPGGQETLLENKHVAMQRIIIAPGEGQRPLDMIMDADSEELAFPTIYAGIKRKTSETFTTIVRSELRNIDRRGCRVDKLFFNYKKLELISIRNNTSICLRKRSASRAITVSNALNEEHMDHLIRHDEGYRVLKGIRTSPAHWEAEKKKVMAMIRQFGLPTFFITLSAAESRWVELLVLLKDNVDKQQVTEDEAFNLSSQEKVRLIRTDPVTCARYFEYRFRKLFRLMKMRGGVFGEKETPQISLYRENLKKIQNF